MVSWLLERDVGNGMRCLKTHEFSVATSLAVRLVEEEDNPNMFTACLV